MNKFTVYVHTAPNNKKYVGITCKSTQERWRNNGEGYHTQQLFWRAIQKYGWDNFQHTVIAHNLSKIRACELEQNLITQYKSNNPKYGYNVSIGGDGPFGVKRTQKTKEKLRQANLGKHHTEETRRKISEHNTHHNKGLKMSDEQKQKISNANKGKTAWNKGKKLSDEYRKKLSDAHKGQIPWNKGVPGSAEMKQKVSIANKGKKSVWKDKKLPNETKQKISKTLTGSIWVHNNNIKQRSLIKANELQKYLNLGYVKGKLFD